MSIQILLSRLSILAVLVVGLSSCSPKKTGYVDIFKLVSEFELQKEYSSQVKSDVEKDRAMIDSIVGVEKLKNPASSENLRNELYAALSRQTEKANKEIDDMVWKRLNPYVQDFGKEKGYQYIYGANGTGNVLYAEQGQDITDELVQYVNKRYHDKK